jgi:hypothetical protein
MGRGSDCPPHMLIDRRLAKIVSSMKSTKKVNSTAKQSVVKVLIATYLMPAERRTPCKEWRCFGGGDEDKG